MAMFPKALLLCAAACGTLWAQSAPRPEFEVASVKATTDPSLPGRITRPPGDRGYHGTNMPLLSYLTVAYQVRASQIVGPEWIRTDHFDVEAKAEKPATVDELHVMLQHLLEDRFRMKLRQENRDQPGFILTVDKDGPKMKAHDSEDRLSAPIMPGWGKHLGTNVTMTYLSFYLSNELDRTVIDKTALPGHYDFEVEWGMDPVYTNAMQAAPPTTVSAPAGGEAGVPVEMRFNPPSGPTIAEALRQQLGLRLESAKVPVLHLVVDHIDKLIEN